MRYIGITLSALMLWTGSVSAEDLSDYRLGDVIEQVSFGTIKTNSDYAEIMFDRQEHVTNKPLKLLQHRAQGKLDNQSLYLGGRFIGTHMEESTDTDGKFPILSRIPNQHTTGSRGRESVINDASFQVTALPTSWLSFFVQGEYTEVEYPGQDSFQMRKYNVLLGDLNRFPLYVSFGRDTVSFGNFTSYAPFTHNHSAHYFWAQSDKPHFEVGFYHDGWHVTGTLIRNDRGLRVINTPPSSGNGFGNYAINARKEIIVNEWLSAEIGSGWLRSTIYDSTLAHHPPGRGAGDNQINSAVNGFGRLTIGDVDLYGEYTRTMRKWPSTDHIVSAFTLQGRYRHDVWELPSIVSVMFSRGEQGSSGTQWERMEQWVLGYEVKLHENMRIGVEYLYNRGFVPLIMPRFTGDRGVDAHTLIAGIELTF